jgi:4-hydroxy-2-oxoheptanedioate aldolase
VVDACRRHNVVPGIHATAALAARRREQGFRMITVSNDLLAIKSTMPDDLSTASGASSEASGEDRLY